MYILYIDTCQPTVGYHLTLAITSDDTSDVKALIGNKLSTLPATCKIIPPKMLSITTIPVVSTSGEETRSRSSKKQRTKRKKSKTKLTKKKKGKTKSHKTKSKMKTKSKIKTKINKKKKDGKTKDRSKSKITRIRSKTKTQQLQTTWRTTTKILVICNPCRSSWTSTSPAINVESLVGHVTKLNHYYCGNLKVASSTKTCGEFTLKEYLCLFSF